MSSRVMACYDHSSEQAVAECQKCGKGLCKDCYDVYGVSAGRYAGKALCYRCTSELVAGNVADFEGLKRQVQWERGWIITGAILGAVLLPMISMDNGADAAGAFVAFIFGAGIGGSLGTILMGVGAMGEWSERGGDMRQAGCIIGAVALILFSPIMTVYRLFSRVGQLKQCDEIIESDSRVLQQMRDYFAYTQTMAQNVGTDLATLAAQGSELYDNTYAKAVLANGEQAAQAELRRSVVQIAENGEIIRSFNPRGRRNSA